MSDQTADSREDNPLSEQELAYWTELLAKEDVSASRTEEDFLVFRLGRERFALAMTDLDEIASLSAGVALPHMGGLIQGLANLRGETLLLLDPATALNAHASPRLGRDNRTLVIKDRQGRRTGFMVDAQEGVIALDPALFARYQFESNEASPIRRVAVAELADRSLFLVDVSPLREASHSHF